jgi:hypothetical protein
MKTVIFFIRHFTERGTEVAIYDYAKYNEEILNNKSYIICFKNVNEQQSYSKFSLRFKILEIENITEITPVIQEYNIDFFYTLTVGCEENNFFQFNNKELWLNCKTIKHCVFSTNYKEADFYISISHFLNEKFNTIYPVIPHIVNLPECQDDLRDDLNIPHDAIVFGRYGGVDEFNIKFVYYAIKEFLNQDTNIYFLFMNTIPFYNHPRIIYLNPNINLLFKTKFINTCDVMIHARIMGETFGLSIAEFSSLNKPIITCDCGDIEHIKILGDKAIVYRTFDELLHIFKNIRTIISGENDWNCYKYYTPENIMKLFQEYIFNKET